jgi:hypothetical protein
MLGGELLADLAEAMTEVGAHAADATPPCVTCGWRNVTIEQHSGRSTDAELAHVVTHA